MKTRQCLAVSKEFLHWLDEGGTLSEVEFLIGDKLHLLSKSMADSHVVGYDGRLLESVSREEAMFAFLIYLSMRYAILKQIGSPKLQK